MSKALAAARRRVADLEANQAEILRQLSESNLKLLYTMRYFRFGQKPIATGLTDANGEPILAAPQAVTLEQLYEQDREKFLALLAGEWKDHQDAEAAKAAEHASTNGHINGHAEGQPVAANDAPTSGEQPTAGDADAPGPRRRDGRVH